MNSFVKGPNVTTATMDSAILNDRSSDFSPVYKHEKKLFTISMVFSFLCWALLIVGTLGIGLVYVFAGFIFYLFAHSALISYIRGTGALVSDQQYPELQKVVRDCAARIGMIETPEVFLLHGNGIFNAFATRFLGRNFVVLYADIVDAVEKNPGALSFYVGHELGHIHRGHLKWMSVLLPSKLIPFLGAAYSRSCEYTADRYGYLCCSNAADAQHALSVLAVGGKKANTLNVDVYLDQVRHSSSFFMSFHEYLSYYPWLTKRVAAVRSYGKSSEPVSPSRNKLALLFALSGGSGLLIGMVAVGIILAAVASNPKLKEFLTTKSPIAALDDAAIANAGSGGKSLSLEQKRAIVSETIANMADVKSLVEAYVQKTKKWPKDNLAINLKDVDSAYGEHVEYVKINDGYINVYYLTSSPLLGAIVTLTSDLDQSAAGGVLWGCVTDMIEAGALPVGCEAGSR